MLDQYHDPARSCLNCQLLELPILFVIAVIQNAFSWIEQRNLLHQLLVHLYHDQMHQIAAIFLTLAYNRKIQNTIRCFNLNL